MSRTLLATMVALCLVTATDIVSAQKAAGKAAAAVPAVVNLNTATATQIATLPGIGEKAAQRIIEYREKNGGFKKIEEILENSRSCPYLLMISLWRPRRMVSRSRKKSQEIRSRFASGGRSGGRT